MNQITPTSPKPSPPSPSSTTLLPSNTKRIRVTSSDGKTANLTLSNTATFSDLQLMIEESLGIPCEYQILRGGYPPKELRQTTDNSPLQLSHGERISVEQVRQPTIDNRTTPLTKQSLEDTNSNFSSITNQLTSLLTNINPFEQLQKFPNLFCKGGHCYEELRRSYGKRLTDGMHVQFAEISNVTFRYNKSKECLDVCLGVDHVPVGSLTSEQMELAQLAATQSDHDMKTDSIEHKESIQWMLNRSNTTSNVKAFSGAGRTLNDTSFEDKLQNIDQLIGKAQLLLSLKSREQQLQTQIRTLNQQLMDIHSGNEALSHEPPSDLETKLLDLSHDLKLVREEIKGLSES